MKSLNFMGISFLPSLGVRGKAFIRVQQAKQINHPPFEAPAGNEDAKWIEPTLVCVVEYMYKNEKGGLRHPVFKGLREDKRPEECVDSGR